MTDEPDALAPRKRYAAKLSRKGSPGYKPMNDCIISIRTARRPDPGQDPVDLWDKTRGQGVGAHVDAYLDDDTAAGKLAPGHTCPPRKRGDRGLATTDGLETMGGGTVKGQLTSRILKIETADTRDEPQVSLIRPAKVLAGCRKAPRGPRSRSCSPRLDAKRAGLAILHHLQAWATVTYLDRIESETWHPRSVTDLADTPPPDFLEESNADPATGEILAQSDSEGSGMAILCSATATALPSATIPGVTNPLAPMLPATGPPGQL